MFEPAAIYPHKNESYPQLFPLMYPQTRKYYVILVHYGDPDQTHKTLTSLINCQLPPHDIIVVDHARLPYFSQNSIACHLIRPQRNTGYAGGINIGLGALISRGISENDIVVVMNNDVIVGPAAFRQLRHYWHSCSGHAILGAAGGHVNLLTGRTCPGQPASRPHHLPYLDGAFLSAPLSVFMRTKGLPEQYFMYWEDALFSARARRRGLPLQTLPTIQVRHQSAAGSQPSGDKLYYLVRNGALFLEQETPPPWRLYWYFANRARLVYHAIRRHRPPAVRRALLDAVRGKTGPRLKQTP